MRFGLADCSARATAATRTPTLTLVHPPDGAEEAGGMEYPTLITTGGPGGRPTGVRVLEIVTVHELGHQWFYGLVATDEHAFPFLDEGVNSYAETESMEAWTPARRPSTRARRRDRACRPAHRSGADAAGNAPVAQAASDFARRDYGALVYSRTATILATLAHVYGEDLVRRAIGRYTRRYRSSTQGRRSCSARSRRSSAPGAGAAARTAFFDEGWVDYP